MSTNTAEAETPETTGSDGPLLDLTDAAVKKFIKQAKARGYVTMDELNKVLPSEEVTSEQIEDTLAMLSEMGVNVVENEETEGEGEGGGEVAQREESSITVAEKPESYDRTDDPVRMYLREMGSVELLSREGVMATLDAIAAEFEAFRKLQERLVDRRLNGEDLAESERKQYGELSSLIIQHLKTLKLNNNRIEALVEQLYAINKRLMGLEGRLLRLADSYGISRVEFLKAYLGAELNPNWGDTVKAQGVRWTKFIENDSGQVA